MLAKPTEGSQLDFAFLNLRALAEQTAAGRENEKSRNKWSGTHFLYKRSNVAIEWTREATVLHLLNQTLRHVILIQDRYFCPKVDSVSWILLML